ncbi:MAG TPA: hypothetical protein VKY74_27885 [Chloroflexia bacterium]|nr:hypothetical protein [Chloroflexia bacterium]
MTSWERGRENEREGQMEEREGANRGDLGEQMRGGAKELGGKVEQGLDNVGDTLSGRQDDLEGNQHNYGKDAATWTEHRGQDIERGARNLGNELDR